MKVKVTKVMARELNKALKGNYCIERVEYDTMHRDAYRIYVSYNLMDNSIDYDYETEEFKFLRIVYKDEMYAMNSYATSKDLKMLARNVARMGKEPTLENFIEEFKAMYSI